MYSSWHERTRVLLGLTLASGCLLLGVAGCADAQSASPGNEPSAASDETQDTDNQDTDNQDSDNQDSDNQDSGTVYKWELPPGDTSPTGNEGPFYGILMRCEQGAADDLQNETWWRGFASPRDVLTFMAAAHLCSGDQAGGRPYYEQALAEYGTSGLQSEERPLPCEVFRSVSSVLEQTSREQIDCPGGDVPGWKMSEDGLRLDNPLTFDIDESETAETPDPSDDPSAETPDSSDETPDETPDDPSAETSEDTSDDTATEGPTVEPTSQ